MWEIEPFRELGVPQVHFSIRGQGPAVLMVHGSQSWSYTWRFQLPALDEAGYQAIAVDLPGNGYSQALPTFDYSIRGMSNFLTAVLNHFGLSSAVLVASSAGGLPALDLAIRQPERVTGLVLVSTCGVHHQIPWLWRMARIPLIGELMGILLNEKLVRQNLVEAVYDAGSITDQDVTAYTKPLKRPGTWKANLKIERSWNPVFVEENLELIQCPTLVVWGEDDPWHPLEMAHEFTKRIKGAQSKILSRCGHLPHEERPDDFNQLLMEFLLSQVQPNFHQDKNEAP